MNIKSFFLKLVFCLNFACFAGPLLAQSLAATQTAGAEPIGADHVVSVVYATDRSIRGGTDHRKYHGTEWMPVHFGICEVGIPPKHAMGTLTTPNRFFGWDPTEHVVFARLERGDDLAVLHATAAARLSQSPRWSGGALGKNVFIFVHGYDNSFESSCRRTAQVWTDLRFSGVPMMYSWASQFKTGEPGFAADQKTVEEWSKRQFAVFIESVTRKFEGSRVHIVAHSMGSRLVMAGLAHLASLPNLRSPIDQVVLFAPEIPSDEFRALAPLAAKNIQRMSLYGSTSDAAFSIVRRFFPGSPPRAGDLSSSSSVIPGVDVINADSVNYSMTGHAYYADSRPVIDDLAEVLAGKSLAERRNIRKASTGRYFEFIP